MSQADALPLTTRMHPRARGLKLRFDKLKGQAIVSHPPHVSAERALAFGRKQRSWIESQLRKAQAETGPAWLQVTQTDFPYQGHSWTWAQAGLSPGDTPALLGWYKARARLALSAEIERLSPKLPRQPQGFSLRDTRSRWGSCSSQGKLNFSWRLILAPPHVLSYVVAHELAHLEYLNHSPAFWRRCAELSGGQDAMERAHGDLQRDGLALMRFMRGEASA